MVQEMSEWQRGDHPHARLHRMVEPKELPQGFLAWYDRDKNIQYINREAFEQLSEFQQAALYRREEAVLSSHDLADAAAIILG